MTTRSFNIFGRIYQWPGGPPKEGPGARWASKGRARGPVGLQRKGQGPGGPPKEGPGARWASKGRARGPVGLQRKGQEPGGHPKEGSQYQLLMRNPLDIDVQGGSQSVRILQPGGGGCRVTFIGGSQTVRILRQGVQRDFPRKIPDSQDPPDTGARGCRGTFPGGSQTVRILRQGVQRDFPRRIPDSQDPPDTGDAEGLFQEDPRQSGSSGHWGCRGTFPGGSQTVRILRTLVPGGAEGLSQEDPRQSGSSGHWCQGVQEVFQWDPPDNQDPLDIGARGCRKFSSPQTVRILWTLVPGGAGSFPVSRQSDPD